MRRRTIASLMFATLLAACAHQGAERPAGMAWSLTSTEREGAKLTYGQPDSDNLDLMLTCLPKSGQVQVWLMGPDMTKETALNLRSGGRVDHLPARVDTDSYDVLRAVAPADAAVFATFAETGRIGASTAQQPSLLPSAGATAARFLASCRR